MDEQAQQELVESRLDAQIRNFKQSRSFYRRGSLFFTLGTAALAALTTLLIGVSQLYDKSWISAMALAAGGLTTVASAWGGWFAFRRMWLNSQATLNALYKLRMRIDYLKAGRAPEGILVQSEIEALYEELQSTLDAANQSWSDVRSADA